MQIYFNRTQKNTLGIRSEINVYLDVSEEAEAEAEAEAHDEDAAEEALKDDSSLL